MYNQYFHTKYFKKCVGDACDCSTDPLAYALEIAGIQTIRSSLPPPHRFFKFQSIEEQ